MKKTFLIYSVLTLACVALGVFALPALGDPLPMADGLASSGSLGLKMLGVAGTVSVFDTRTLLKAIDQRQRPTTFLLGTFFKGEETFDTEAVDIEIIKGKRRLAPFVAPVKQGKLVEELGRTMKSFKPPYVKPKAVIKPSDLNAPATGEAIYSGGSNRQQRLAQKVGERMAELDDTITEREEWMAAQALDSGVVLVKGDGVDTSVDFVMGATHKVTLAGAALWTDAGSTPIEDLIDWCQTVAKDSGLVPDKCVMGIDAWKAFSAHADVKDRLNNRRIQQGKIDPQQLPEGVTYCGSFTDSGVDIDIYTYNSWFTDDDGTVKPFVPVDKVWLGSSKAKNKKLYGCIQDLKAGNFAVRRFPKSWEQDDPSVRYLMVQSAPLPGLLQPDAFLSAKAV